MVVDEWSWANITGSCCRWAGLGWQFSDGGFSDAAFLNSYSVRVPEGIIRMFYFSRVILTLQGCCALCKSQNDKASAKNRMKWNFKNFDLQEMFWPHQKRRRKDNARLFLEYSISLQGWDSNLLFQFEWKLNVELFDFLIAGDISAVSLRVFVNWMYSPIFSNLFILVSTPLSANHL